MAKAISPFVCATKWSKSFPMLVFLLLLFQVQGIYQVGQGVTPPSLIRRVEPHYTEEARAARVSGTVVLETIVSETGEPSVASVVRSLGKGLDESATRAVEQWRFRPSMKDGVPVKVRLNIEVSFNLAVSPATPPSPSAPAIAVPVPASTSLPVPVTVVAADPNSRDTLYAATRTGIYKTIDGGASWRSAGSVPDVSVIAINPRNSSILYAANRAGFFRSNDAGNSWTALQQLSPRVIRFDLINPSTLYIATFAAISKSADGGNSWTDLLPGRFSTLELTDGSRMLAISDSGALYSSIDRGARWQFIGSNLSAAERTTIGNTALASADRVDQSLIAPRLTAPDDGAVFSTYPREMTLKWQPSPNAASYVVEWDYSYNGKWHLEEQKLPDDGFPVRGTEYTFEFVGAQSGRWRVFPVNAAGARGTPSEWRTFRFTK